MARPETERAVAKFLAYFAEVKKLHETTMGTTLEMYKDTEPTCLESVFESLWRLQTTGLAFVADAINALVWGQCLGNGNHRTTILFMRTFLESTGVPFPHYSADRDATGRFEKSMNGWTNRSQALIRRRGEPEFAQARLAPKHKEITLEWVAEMLGLQSEVLTMVGPQRLMDFIS